MRNSLTLAALCAVAAPATAQERSASAQLEAALADHSSVADLLDAVGDCAAETTASREAGASGFEARGWVKLSGSAINLERSAPTSQSHAYVRRNISLSVTQLAGGTTCRIIAFLDGNTDRSSLTQGLQQDMEFIPISRESKFALRNPSVSDELLSQFFETRANLVRVKFEPEGAALGVNIVVAPNL